MTLVLGAPLISQTLLQDLERVGRKYNRWTQQAYFELDGNYLVEFSQGRLEILPMPTVQHQRIARRLMRALEDYLSAAKIGGEPFFMGTKVRIRNETFREPDVLYVPRTSLQPGQNEYVQNVTWVAEIISESNREHDTETKRSEYAEAGIAEYWLIDPEFGQISILRLSGKHYVVNEVEGAGDVAKSVELAGFSVVVNDLLAPAD